MKNIKTKLQGMLVVICFSFLILDARCAAHSVSEGIKLCLWTVVPALYPFVLLSPMLVDFLPNLSVLRFIGKFLGMPAGSESIFVAGLLSGYPVGAQMVSDAWRNGQLSRKEAQRMLTFCNNAGPAFIFGIGGALFSDYWVPWTLWAIHILSALLVGAILPGKTEATYCARNNGKTTFHVTLKKSTVVMAQICSWIIVMRIILSFMQRWVLWILPAWIQVLISGFLELANGCSVLHLIDDPSARFLILSGFLSFGGISVHMQTASVTGSLNGFGHHLFGKLLQTAFSITLSSLLILLLHPGEQIQSIFIVLPTAMIYIIFVIAYLSRKNGSFLKPCSV